MDKKQSNPLDKMAESLAANIVSRFSSVEKWKQTWRTQRIAPYNAHTKNEYKGYNALALILSGLEQNFSDPRWMTFNQAKDAGYKVIKGQKSTLIGFFNVTEIDYDTNIPIGLHLSKDAKDLVKKTLNAKGIKVYRDFLNQSNPEKLISDITGNPLDGKKLMSLLSDIKAKQAKDIVFKNHNVFNAEQIEGIPALEEINTKNLSLDDENLYIKMVENIIDNAGVLPIVHDAADPKYIPSKDTIMMPPPSNFENAYEYYATYMHELVHSTGHENRIDRNFSIENKGSKLKAYAREELVAEFASLLINTKAGLSMSEAHLNNHAAYLKSWSSAISEDPKEIFNVIREAGKAAEYVLDMAENKDKFISENRVVFNSKLPDNFTKSKHEIINNFDGKGISAHQAATAINKLRFQATKANSKDVELEL